MPTLDSTSLLRVDYDANRRILTATFRHSRRTYDYLEVPPQAYAALMAAPSRGAWFNHHIRERYPHRERR